MHATVRVLFQTGMQGSMAVALWIHDSHVHHQQLQHALALCADAMQCQLDSAVAGRSVQLIVHQLDELNDPCQPSLEHCHPV